jgi:hypothetical protein
MTNLYSPFPPGCAAAFDCLRRFAPKGGQKYGVGWVFYAPTVIPRLFGVCRQSGHNARAGFAPIPILMLKII